MNSELVKLWFRSSGIWLKELRDLDQELQELLDLDQELRDLDQGLCEDQL